MFRLVDQFYDSVKGSWEDRFERSYGYWRGFVDEVVLAFLACGDFQGGFARVVCDDCRAEYLVAFSCTRRGFCTSCAAKRAAIFAAQLREEILEPVGHAQWVFTIPKMLRPYLLHHRRLLGKLSQAAFATVQEPMAQALDEDSDVRPGMVLQMRVQALESSAPGLLVDGRPVMKALQGLGTQTVHASEGDVEAADQVLHRSLALVEEHQNAAAVRVGQSVKELRSRLAAAGPWCAWQAGNGTWPTSSSTLSLEGGVLGTGERRLPTPERRCG